jgi:hypothetical protein
LMFSLNSPPPFLIQDRVLSTIPLGWFWTLIFLISASWVARITDVSSWHPTSSSHFFCNFSIWT